MIHSIFGLAKLACGLSTTQELSHPFFIQVLLFGRTWSSILFYAFVLLRKSWGCTQIALPGLLIPVYSTWSAASSNTGDTIYMQQTFWLE